MVNLGRLVAVIEAASADTVEQRRCCQEDRGGRALFWALLEFRRSDERAANVALQVGQARQGSAR